jgi:hypothetical protein
MSDQNKTDPYKLIAQLDSAMYRYNTSGSKLKNSQMEQRRGESEAKYEREQQKEKERANNDYHAYRKSMGLKSNPL